MTSVVFALLLAMPAVLLLALIAWAGRAKVALGISLGIAVVFVLLAVGLVSLGSNVGHDGEPLSTGERATYSAYFAIGAGDLIAFGGLLYLAMTPPKRPTKPQRSTRRRL